MINKDQVVQICK